jgi:hypothetical protein
VPGHHTHAWIRLAATGEVADTVIEPALIPADSVTGRRGSSGRQLPFPVPFGRGPLVVVGATGEFVFGYTTPFVLHTVYRARPVRMEKDWIPVPMSDEEREEAREETAAFFRQDDPRWTWNGPDVPPEKPPVQRV